MKATRWLIILLFLILLISCKQESGDTVVELNTIENETITDSIITDSPAYKKYEYPPSDYESEDEEEFTYRKFDKQEVLESWNLGSLMEKRSLEELFTATLRDGDSIRAFIYKSGEGTFDVYRLSSNGIDIADFYPEGDQIDGIHILDAAGVPEDMIHPGLPFEELKKTYEDPIAYGSEIEARVYVAIDEVIFRMSALYGVPEPIDIEDDTEILLIQF